MKEFYALAIQGLLYLGLASLALAQATGKPNFVFILTDDQDQKMNSLVHMNKVQKYLLNEGTHFTRHYAPTALCCPARVSRKYLQPSDNNTILI